MKGNSTVKKSNNGGRVHVVDYGGVVSLVPLLDNPEDEGFGALKQQSRSLLKGLKRDRAEERRHKRTGK